MYYSYPPLRNQNSTNNSLQNTIIVIGEGTINATPDQAIVSLGVITENKNLQQAQSKNAEQANQLINALLNQGIPREKIRTIDYRIDLNYDYKEGEQIFRGYRVTNMLEVIVDEIQNVGQIVDLAIQNGANTVSNINMTLTNRPKYYSQALTNAVMNAQQKAAIIAKTIGVNVNQVPHKIKEISKEPDYRPRELVLGMSTDSAPTPIEPGRIEVKSIVEATFIY